MSAISQKSAADSITMSAPDAAAQAPNDGLGEGVAGSWQQAAGVFSAIASMLSSELTTRDADQQNRAHLIQQLDELETTLRNGGADDRDRLKAELARLEAELRAWLGKIPDEPLGCTAGATDTCLNGEGAFDCGGEGEEAEGAEGADLPVFVTSSAAQTISNQSETLGLPQHFEHRTRDVQESSALGAAAHSTLVEWKDCQNRALDSFPAVSIDNAGLDGLAKRIEASHRQLATRLETGLASALNEIGALKNLIAGAAAKIEQAGDADRSEHTGVPGPALRFDRADEGFVSLTSLERAIDGLSVQLEETRQIASRWSDASAGQQTDGSWEAASGPAADTQRDDRVLREIANMGALHEGTWQRVHATLAGIQQSLEHIAKGTIGGVTHGPGIVSVSTDPFAPILTSLAQHGQDGSPAARVIIPVASERGARDKDILQAGATFSAARPAAGTFQPDDATETDRIEGERETGSFLIEPGLGFPGRSGDSATRGPGISPPKIPQDRESAGRTDFIAAARRAARAAQLQGASARSAGSNGGVQNAGIKGEGVAAPDAVPFHRGGRGFFVRYKRPLVLTGALLLAAIGAYAATRTVAHDRFSDLVPEFLKKFERGALRAKPAAAGEGPGNRPLVEQKPSQNPSPPNPSPPNQSQANQPHTSELARDLVESPAIMGVRPLDPRSLAGAGFSTNSAAPTGIPAATRVIAGGNAIVAGTFDILDRSNGAGNSARQRLPAAIAADNTGNSLQPTAVTSATAGSPNSRAALENLMEAAKSGDAAAQFELAVRYAEGAADGRNYEMAAQWYGRAAEQGLAVAEYRLASLCERGLGVAQDMQRAKNLYQRAAEKGNTRAMHNLGVLAVESTGGKPNYTSAVLWFGKAAEYGIRDSQYNIAVLLARGLGMPKDLVKSYTWFAIVAAAGDTEAAKKRDDIAARLTSSELANANAAAAAFTPRQADQAANEAAPPAAKLEASPSKPGQPVKPKLSGL